MSRWCAAAGDHVLTAGWADGQPVQMLLMVLLARLQPEGAQDAGPQRGVKYCGGGEDREKGSTLRVRGRLTALACLRVALSRMCCWWRVTGGRCAFASARPQSHQPQRRRFAADECYVVWLSEACTA